MSISRLTFPFASRFRNVEVKAVRGGTGLYRELTASSLRIGGTAPVCFELLDMGRPDLFF